MQIPYGWIDEWPNCSLTISNRPWCPFVRLTTFYGFARSHKEVSPSHAKRLAWLNLKIMRLSTGSHRCPPHHGVPPLSTTMIRAKHAIRLPVAPHPRRPPWHLWNSHLENKSEVFLEVQNPDIVYWLQTLTYLESRLFISDCSWLMYLNLEN